VKIAIVHNLPSGGGKRALHEFCRQLVQQGHHLDLYHPSLANEEFLPLAPHVDNVFSFPIPRFQLWHTRLLPFVIQYLNLPRQISYLHRLKYLYARMAHTIDGNDYDLAFIHHCRVLQSPYILRYLNTPTVYYCQEPPRRLYEPELVRRTALTRKQRIQRTWYAPANRLYAAIQKRDDYSNARSANLMLVNSYFSRESIYRVYGVNARVNYLGIDETKFRPAPAIPKEASIITVGRTYPEKGHTLIIQALSCVPKHIRPTLIIIGDMRDPDEERYFSSLAREHGVSFQIQSGISDKELVNWFQRSLFFVYAPIMEPFGFAPLEAMACGLPVVAVKEGGVRETVVDGETGFLTQRDPYEFAEKLRFLLEHPEIAARYGQQARQHVQRKWTWERAVQELVQNFQRIQRT
jgi:glycosyltransferase involved in cell wall biosynthesis